jgi:NADP-dependent 3-hydroxy acid dehydrogenase YdfG
VGSVAQRAAAWPPGFIDAFGEVEPLHAEDIASAIAFIVTNPRRVAINEIVVRPTDQP